MWRRVRGAARTLTTRRLDTIARIGPFTPGPDDLIGIGKLLEDEAGADGGPADAARHERDRALGRRLGDDAVARPLAALLAWRDEREREAGRGGAGAMSAVSVGVAALGAVIGALAASGAFFYDGSARVNVLLLLGLFVVLPALTLVLFALAGGFRIGLGRFNPGRVGVLVGRLAPAHGDRELARLAAGSRGPDVARWLVLTWSQWLALGFGAGALAAALALVVFTDLAFGWSTTLDLDAGTLRRILEALAVPWRAVVPAAVPSAELVETSRYFRIAADVPVAEPARLGRWWPFVALAMLVYGVVPRLLTTPFARWRLARACRHALLADPEVQALLERMTTPRVETRARDPEWHGPPAAGSARFVRLPPAAAWQVVNWAAVPVERAALEAALAPARVLDVHAAGGARRTTEDRELARQLAGAPPGSGVLVVARGFDPPTLDLMDFVGDVRAALAPGVPVAIAPIAVVDGAPAALAPRHGEVWASALARHARPGVQAVRLEHHAPP